MTQDEQKWAHIERITSAKSYAKKEQNNKKQFELYEQKIESLEKQLNVFKLISSSKNTDKEISINSRSKTGEATAFAIASDWHSEETVDPDTINNLNEYNLAIAEKRIENFFGAVLRLTEIERAGTNIDNLVLALLGDFMTGYIHEELIEGNSLSPVETLLWVKDKIVKGINTLRNKGRFKKIIIPCCFGNHGRTTMKSRIATGAKNSFEWLMYKWLSESLTDGVEWQVATGYHTYLNIYDKTIRLHHGDSLSYQGGVGGLTIPVEKAIAQWNKGRSANLDVFGHWHQMQQNPKWVSNGSLIGYSPYALKIKASYEPPQQTFFLFDSKRGRTGTWPIFV